MFKFRTLRTRAVLLSAGLLVAVPALAAGFYTNGVPQVLPGASYFAGNGQFSTSGGSLFTYSGELGGYELLPADTQLGGGASPQTVAPTAFQIASIAAAAALNNVAVASGSAGTNSVTIGSITWTLATASGASATLTLTNTTVTAASKVQVGAYLGTSTAGAVQIVSVVPAAGSVAITLKNIGSAAFNGTINIPFQVM